MTCLETFQYIDDVCMKLLRGFKKLNNSIFEWCINHKKMSRITDRQMLGEM